MTAAAPNGSSPARVLLFAGGGPIALAALEALGVAHEIVGIARPGLPKGASALRRGISFVARATRVNGPDPVSDWARANGVPEIRVSGAGTPADAARLGALRADLGCIATYPRILAPEILESLGTVLNAHPSLLPRHRGPDPLFWTYHAGDAVGGVTVHTATAEADAGPIHASLETPIGRGESVVAVHGRYAELTGRLLRISVDAAHAGRADPVAQDARAATRAPRVHAGRSYARLADWPVEHAWHFLAGLVERYREPFVDPRGGKVEYTGVEGFEARSPEAEPGSVLADGSGWRAWARDGCVHLSG